MCCLVREESATLAPTQGASHGSFDLLRGRRGLAQGKLSFPQMRDTCKVPVRLDLLPLFDFINLGFLKGCFKKSKEAGKLCAGTLHTALPRI